MDFASAFKYVLGGFKLTKTDWSNEYIYLKDGAILFRGSDLSSSQYAKPDSDLTSGDWFIYEPLGFEDQLFSLIANPESLDEAQDILIAAGVRWHKIVGYPGHSPVKSFMSLGAAVAYYDCNNSKLYLSSSCKP